ncbi:hypothetical protein APHWI1_1350 [Anaplasma phagocytophilum str. ApWI1]|uniref:Uncharacterized protein n=1 Tax=Anaplasma phagocytophilum str. ApWI1 TaxID=1359155 RepID=A0A0F3Q294_ANAPH|nr:hypothetical protein APHWEB_0169 [Anaplasma phagocytophilum str. Webster]KJV85564.1 hypothetical protein APHWI1_1350 [Anaplasma phagocytophilum str. ApWI1]KJV87933.1 hypothetical protein APHNYW_0301 [Anaplasma phagocytophilum str. ApNYW]KJV99368.1 hypothetical protein OTSANNIE_0546 [Anaplasma phagocytophilum str. Annie]KJZ98585.1 hypothetical protein APHCR_1297 [Anaplasma phagocytophilum str. CR1007]
MGYAVVEYVVPCTLARTQYTCGCRMEMSQLGSTTGLICVL